MKALFAGMRSVFWLGARRLLAQRGLALAATLGLVAAIALTTSIPMYADAVYGRLFRTTITEDSASFDRAWPPFAFLFQYSGSYYGNLPWEKVEAVDRYLTESAGSGLGLPQQQIVRQFKTDTLAMFSQQDAAYADLKDPLLWVRIGFQSDLQEHITLVEGQFPSAASQQDQPVEVLISEKVAQELGLQAGEKYTLVNPQAQGANREIEVRIAGMWQAANPQDDYWPVDPHALDETLLVPEETFAGRINSFITDPVSVGTWYLRMDGSRVGADQAGPLISRITTFRQQVDLRLPHTKLEISPLEALDKYRQSAGLLTVLLYAYDIPIMVLLLAFIALVAQLAVDQRRNEIAMLRSRGATTLQVIGISVVEGGLIGIAAYLIGVPGGSLVAQLIGKTRSFLDFNASSGLDVRIGLTALRTGLIVAGIALAAQVIPSISASGQTIVTYKRELARQLRSPLWQRLGLDFLLLAPVVYGTYLLRRQGSIVLPLGMGSANLDIFQNPLLFFVPALGMLALGLIMLRLIPLIMRGVAWVSAQTSSVGVLMAARHLARSPGFYATPFLLLVLTLSLSTFTASLAQTLDQHTVDQVYYRIGADLSLNELGEAAPETAAASGASAGNTGTGSSWFFIPVSEHLKVPGVAAAARVGQYPATAQLSSAAQKGTFLGIDRLDFLKVAYWRSDFSPTSLGALMNALALQPDGILVPRSFLSRYALKIGDPLQMGVVVYGQLTSLELKIAGVFDLFPTWYPQEDPIFVGNLDYLFERAGGQFPYQVWLKTDPGADPASIVDRLKDVSLKVLDWQDARAGISDETVRPERQGLFGLLSIGFSSAAVLTVLGFFLYALYSFRRRFIELGVLRAIGLSIRQMTAFLAWELAFLMLSGLAGGTLLGIWASRLFIPTLQIGGDAAARIPPYQVLIAWPEIFRIYALFAILFLGALAVLTALLVRLKIFQAVKLGETA
ncbi:MAG: FtsX-like permease family protein [Chloroflexi bacterium]|nr:FtsX-like permease family protein [Chloroflexota bacterium]